MPHGSPLELSIRMQWRELGTAVLRPEGALEFPAAPPAPALYRFRLIGQDKLRHYIGERMELRRRLYHYKNPGPRQATNIRVNELLRRHLAAGGQVAIDVILDGIGLQVGGDRKEVSLADKATRRMLEHAALVAEGGKEIEMLNR